MSIVTRRSAITGLGIALATPPLATPPLASPALAQSADVFRIGLILPMTGPFASTGRQIDAAIRAWLRANPAPIAGKRIEILLRDRLESSDAIGVRANTVSKTYAARLGGSHLGLRDGLVRSR
jgi:ABC-type branched-subunit amino acid transport system substrate-binding protein